ncbi:MAG: hypothetical protein Terrestrivirus1_348 [Terrestrivirus sp.]|uniref:Uncharacterized protein n=1 Tax=Terrestrivirus sp. TaxID=2487775 RepID=A0A3G4ZM32_9VIRU|nr:MAG: hypothetical protein Terrestrivirus1_348 [Terrestrivirus sp.]
MAYPIAFDRVKDFMKQRFESQERKVKELKYEDERNPCDCPTQRRKNPMFCKPGCLCDRMLIESYKMQDFWDDLNFVSIVGTYPKMDCKSVEKVIGFIKLSQLSANDETEVSNWVKKFSY